MRRLGAVDAFRGLLILLMALDHANLLIGKQTYSGREFWGGDYSEFPTLGLFCVRFLTHPCAVGFCFLMGLSIILMSESRRADGWTNSATREFLILRGLVLILIQFSLENLGWRLGGFPIYPVYFGVLSLLGSAMIVSAFVLSASWGLLLVFGLLSLVVSILVVPASSDWGTAIPVFRRLLGAPGKTAWVNVYYSLFPWLAYSFFGMALGKRMMSSAVAGEKGPSRKWVWWGISLLGLAAVLRLYGGLWANLREFPMHDPWGIFYMTKYPPNLVFSSFGLGIAFLVIGLFKSIEGSRLARFLENYGHSAFFFYIVHIYFFGVLNFLFPKGTNLIVVYTVWALGCLALYWPCRLWAQFKKQQSRESLWRLF